MTLPSLSSQPAAGPVGDQNAPPLDAPVAPQGRGQVPLWRSGVVLVLTLLIGLAYRFDPPLDIVSQSGVVMDLPIVVGDYLGKKGAITKIEYDLLPKDTEFARRYYDDNKGHQINCSIVLSGAEQRSIHRPEGCLTGQGWTIIGQDYIPISLLSGRMLTARRLTLQRQVVGKNGEHFPVRAFYVYWFVGQGVTTGSEMKRVLLSNWDRVVHNHAHRWAYVSVFSLITDNLGPNGLDPDQTQKMLVDFTRQIVPTFQVSEMAATASK